MSKNTSIKILLETVSAGKAKALNYLKSLKSSANETASAFRQGGISGAFKQMTGEGGILAGTLGKVVGGISLATLAFKAFRGIVNTARRAVRYLMASISEYSVYDEHAYKLISLTGSLKSARSAMYELTEGKHAVDQEFGTDSVVNAYRNLHKFSNGALATAENVKLMGDIAIRTGADISTMAAAIGLAWSKISANSDLGLALRPLITSGAISASIAEKMEAMQKSGADVTEIWREFRRAIEGNRGAVDLLSTSLEGLKKANADAAGTAKKQWGQAFEPLAIFGQKLKEFFINANLWYSELFAKINGVELAPPMSRSEARKKEEEEMAKAAQEQERIKKNEYIKNRDKAAADRWEKEATPQEIINLAHKKEPGSLEQLRLFDLAKEKTEELAKAEKEKTASQEKQATEIYKQIAAEKQLARERLALIGKTASEQIALKKYYARDLLVRASKETDPIEQAKMRKDAATRFSEIERLTAEQKIDAKNKAAEEDKNRKNALRKERDYEFSKLPQEKQLQYLESAILKFDRNKKNLSPDQREKLVGLKERRDRISEAVQSDKASSKDAANAAEDRLSSLKRPTKSEIGISQYFDWMRSIKNGKSPDQQIVENTKAMRDILKTIAKNTAEGGFD